jgi:multidrug efflux pump subunit AcrA (membrane-fusion protein)
MSIEQPPDPRLIEQTKQQIRSLVGEISQLSKTDVAPEEFYGQFLPKVVSALAAVGGAVWTTNPEGRLALQYQINIQETHLRDNEEYQAQHSRLLYKALSCNEGMLVPPYSGPGDEEQTTDETPAANPTAFLVLLGVLKTDLETIGLVEIFQRSDTVPSAQQGYLRFLLQMCELAGDFLKSHQLRHFSSRQALWTQLEDFARNVHASLHPREAAYTIANEGRRLIDCDRVSVAIRHGKRCTIEAISGQDMFDKRSNTVRLLGRLATAVVASGDAVWYAGDTRDMPPQVEEAVQEYVDEAHSKTVAVVPLRRPPPPEEDDPKKRVEPEPPFGALIVEQIEDSRVTSTLTQRTEVVCLHSSMALANALEHQSLFLMPVWRAIGKSRWVVEARTLPKTLSIGGGVLILLLILCLWPADFTIEAKGTVEPTRRQNVYAAVNGEVDDLPKTTADGATVAKGQLLLRLQSTEVEQATDELQGQWRTKQEQYYAVQRRLRSMAGKGKSDDRMQLEGEQAALKEELRSLDDQLKSQRAKQQELNVKSPIDGVIVTWDLRDRLTRRPVKPGDTLMRVADPTGPWQLELYVPDNHMGHVLARQQELYKESRKTLREMLQADARRKLGDAASNDDVAQAADAKLDEVPDEMLREKILDLSLARLRDQLQPIANDISEPTLRAKVGQALRDPDYDEARAQLRDLLSEVADESLRARLQAVAADLPDAPDDRLKATYVMATDASKKYIGRVTEMHRSAEVHGDEGNTVLTKVAIDQTDLLTLRPTLRPGATVTANIHCGRRPWGYVLLHDLVEFVEAKIFFRYF